MNTSNKKPVTFPNGKFTVNQAAQLNAVSKATMLQRIKVALTNGELVTNGTLKNNRVGRPQQMFSLPQENV